MSDVFPKVHELSFEVSECKPRIPGFTIVKGVAAGLIWKSFETISQVSVRNVLMVAADMVRTKLFGRDISRFS